MAKVARDNNKKIYAHDVANLPNQNVYYSCNNPKCPAKLKIVAINSEYYTKPYFSNIGSKTSHLQNCPYSSSKSGINANYDDTSFNMLTFTDSIFSTKKKLVNSNNENKHESNRQDTRLTPIRTLSQLYYYAKQHSTDYKIDTKPIYKLLSDQRDRSRAFFSGKNVYIGILMAEVVFKRYHRTSNIIEVKPCFNLDLTYSMICNDSKIMEQILGKIFNSTQKPFIVFGDWK